MGDLNNVHVATSQKCLCHFKAISQVQLYQLKVFLSQYTSTATVWSSYLVSQLSDLPFQNHFPKYNSTDLKSSVLEDINSDHAVSPPYLYTEWPAISRPSPQYSYTNSKSSVSKETSTMAMQSLPPRSLPSSL